MITLEEILAAGGQLKAQGPELTFRDFSYDSRQTQPGELFVALRTPHADGHDYIAAARAAGATGVLCTWPPGGTEDFTVILAADPTNLLQTWAAQRLAKIKPVVIGVTGSVGKTTTKRAIATLLTALGPTFGSRQSFNSLFGLPLALARLQENHQFAVLEFGADRFGEIAQLAHLFPPQIAVITNVGSAHLKAFGSLAGVAQEKAALIQALPNTGWAILNGDDYHALQMEAQTKASILRFGQTAASELWASTIRFSVQGTYLTIHWQGHPNLACPPGEAEAFCPLLGEPAVKVALAAVSVALICGLDLASATTLLHQVRPAAGRLNLLPAKNGALLLDDSFNAALPSTLAALHTLAILPAQRRVVVLGELNDLGIEAPATYQALGEAAGAVADLLVCKGDCGLPIVQAARQVQPQLQTAIVHTAAAALSCLEQKLGTFGPGDLFLVKGSASARMERISAGLLSPEKKPASVLVRQEPGWHSVKIAAPDRPTWVRIDLDALATNIQHLRSLARSPLMAVIKADAYGHGAIRVARVALANGAVALAVATLGEARILREADLTAPILVLGYTPPWQAREAIWLDVLCTVFDLDAAKAFSDAAFALQSQAKVHIKVDTGMARLGLQPNETGGFLHELASLPNLEVAGLFTHFATADSADETFARIQLQRFTKLLQEITKVGLRPPLVHAANSAALLRFPEAHFDLVRPGIACYGLNPSAETLLPPKIQPILSFHTEIAQVKKLPAGVPLSYGCTFVTPRPSLIATIPVGYADGFRRFPPWRAVLICGKRVPVVGRICMDYALIDVTDIANIKRGDSVVLIGQQGAAQITADEVATWLGTINYEVVSTILPRVPRETER